MTSDEKSLISSLINYTKSDLFTLDNISSNIELTKQNDEDSNVIDKWTTLITMLPLDFYRIIESYPNMYSIEKFDTKYIRNPKMYAYDKYGSTNMWRAIMILNRCPNINRFNFEFIRYYNITTFSEVLSVLISRMKNNE